MDYKNFIKPYINLNLIYVYIITLLDHIGTIL